MFREMRRKNQLLSFEECSAVLERGTSGVLAISGDNDYPYAVPISYVYLGNKLFFHSAKGGHKIDAIRRNNRGSFCVIDQDQIMSNEYTTYFRSVIVFGKIKILDCEQSKLHAIEQLAMKYAPNDTVVNRNHAINRDWKQLCVFEMEIEYMSGKESIETRKSKPKQGIS